MVSAVWVYVALPSKLSITNFFKFNERPWDNRHNIEKETINATAHRLSNDQCRDLTQAQESCGGLKPVLISLTLSLVKETNYTAHLKVM